jgi:hypothetical protein
VSINGGRRRAESMAEIDKKRAEKAAKEATKEEESKDKQNKSPGPRPMGGGDAEVNEAAGSRIKTEGAD